MEINIQDVKILEGKLFSDIRGKLKKTFQLNSFNDQIQFSIKEIWFTKSQKNVIRGMHLQLGNKPTSKLISVINGKIEDVLIDLRPSSSTFLNVFSIILDECDSKVLYVPMGIAHGYKALVENTIVMYNSNEIHDEKNDVGIRWDSFEYDWKIKTPILSERDKNLIDFKKYIKEISL